MSEDRYEKALLDPAAVYGTPEAVLRDDSLSTEHKLEVLRHWEAEAVHLQESEAEGLVGGEASLLDQVKAAIASLERGA